MSEFKIPNISTLIGSRIGNYRKVLSEETADKEYMTKVILTGLLITLSTPFHWWESMRLGRKVRKHPLKKPPVFILGHWRSGTTFLHNLLCQDPDAAYVTTYQSVFPNNMASKWIFKTYMKAKMPDKRPADKMDLNINYPQEDEFALGNLTHLAYYHFFYYPRNYRMYYDRSVNFEGRPKEHEQWLQAYKNLLHKAAMNSGKDQLFVKNPVNSARLQTLVKDFPDAKFIYIYRNPLHVILSTRRFFYPLMPTLWLHEVDQKFIDTMIFETYRKLVSSYERDKHLIPQDNLVEIRYEDFITNPLSQLQGVYKDLLHQDFSKKKPIFEKYINSLDRRSGKKYGEKESLITQIEREVGEFMDLYHYEREIKV